MKHHLPLTVLFSLLTTLSVWGQGQKVMSLTVMHETIAGPQTNDDYAQWLGDLKRWRSNRLTKLDYQGTEYERPELKWTQSSFIQPQMMVEDRYFFDPLTGKYTVDRYLDDLEKRYGKIDSVLVWAVYPNIGIDDRNQFDMVRALPGGLTGVRGMVADFHRRGVKVLFPVMPWETGTHDESEPLWESIAKELKAVDADGVNGDTMKGLPKEYRDAADKSGHALAFEPEVGFQNESDLPWNNLTWGYWWEYTLVPSVSKYKWLESRHMVNVCNRWARDHTDDLQHAFFNGVGFESWENIWGIWNGLTPRDAEAVRRIAKIERAGADLLVSHDWTPHVPTLQHGVFASQFPGREQTLWTLVNRMEYDISSSQIQVPHHAGTHYFDLWHGVELSPRLVTNNGAVYADLSFEIEGRGYGAVLATDANLDGALTTLLADMKTLAQKPLADFSAQWNFLPQTQLAIPATRPARTAPDGMVEILAGPFVFAVSGIEVEGKDNNWVDVQLPQEESPRRYHRLTMTTRPYYIDRYPVTNAKFKEFVDMTHYHPADDYNFLKDWKDGNYPTGWGNKPVTWVSLEDARAYATWAGKRLPHEWEWQYAAQGSDGRLYPWGNEWNTNAVPLPDEGHTLRPPTDVDAFPQGASPFGVMDLAGNIWQWTDEYVDEHTRAAILRGGSYYHPQGSKWYFPNSAKLNEHAKLLLMSPGKDRSGTVGFRCVVDVRPK
ncbi:MAG TPA: SUMF1/EgtB/PvdO family nonheme iron enzyme [Verrucomicrobiae bacterium]|jgi:formylglycine-generating enzyme required for sulfatase activity